MIDQLCLENRMKAVGNREKQRYNKREMKEKKKKKRRIHVDRLKWTVYVLSSGVDTSGPAHGGAVGTGQGNTSGSGTASGQSEDLYTLEAEITELQRENARVESQVLRLRSDITAMENQLKQGEKVSTLVLSR